MSIISRLIGAGDMLLYHDYRSGSFRDFSGNNNHGTPTGDLGLQRSGLYCGGVSNKVQCSSDFIGTSACSIVAYITFHDPAPNHYGRIISNDKLDFFRYKTATTDRMYFKSDFVTVTSSASNSIAPFGKYCVAVTRDASGANTNHYVDGVLSGTANQDSGTPEAGSPVVIANWVSSTIRGTSGNLHAIVVVNRVLTVSELQEIQAELQSKKWNQKTISHSVIGNSGLPLDGNVKASYSLPGVTDLTGNGYNATLTGSPRKEKNSIGQRYRFDGSGDSYISIPLSAWPGTTGAIEFICNVKSGSGNTRLFGTDHSSGNNYENRTYGTGSSIQFYFRTDATNLAAYDSNLELNTIKHLVCQWEYDGSTNTTMKIFADGVEADTDTKAMQVTTPDTAFTVALWGTTGFDGEVYEVAIHDAVRTEAQWAARMKQFFAKEAISLGNGALETVSNVTSGPLPGTPFEVESGTFKTTYDTINGKPVKVIESVANDSRIRSPLSAFQNNENEAAYGIYEFWLNKATGSVFKTGLFFTEIGPYNATGQDGYVYQVTSVEYVEFYRIVAAGYLLLAKSNTGEATESVWEKHTIKRTSSNLFSLYINDELVTITSGTPGTNPLTESTNTSGKYWHFEMDTGDKIAIAGFDGTPLLLKRKGVA